MKQLMPAVNSSDHIYGNKRALIELVEYGDYQCLYCGRAYPLIKNMQKELGPHLKVVYRNFPLSKSHPYAFAAAIAAEAAALQDKFWEMHDTVFENQEILNIDSLIDFAEMIGLNLEKFKQDIQKKVLADKVERDFESGLRSGVNKIPSFYINGNKYEGNWEEGGLFNYLKSKMAEIAIF
ncbi:disulfide bond formation protein DsbA [Terrimonas sp.]|uniref:DsbA family protein n=1 Tax=Terrimonas sp. TaxID=1914338 RepID=UPI000D520ABB|nr:DsbA family protein [Terrimonas sp.]PVD52392.1 disulfide bond formation protein DsbA [Terrimonas sp.]